MVLKQKIYNENTMTAAEFRSMIISSLRSASRWWKPKNVVIKRAWRGRNAYQCELCGTIGPANLPPLPGKKRKRKNILADHRIPVVGPEGFTTYDLWIDRCFVTSDKLQAICWNCHTEKTRKETVERKGFMNNIKKG